VAWRTRHCGIFEAEHGGVTYYFIDNEGYFKRWTLYDEFDNAERFAFFSRAVLEFLPFVDFKPDIIVANDWQTGLVPVYHFSYYTHSPWYGGIKMVTIVHNIAFQGKYNYNIFGDLLGLPDWAFAMTEWGGGLNFLKGAMQASNAIVTVSPTYAAEISGHRWDSSGFDFGQGLTPFLNAEHRKLIGIINGVDMDSIDPSKDKNLYENYNAKYYKRGKAKNKKHLQERLGLEQRKDVPLIGLVTRIDSRQKGCQIVLETLYGGLLNDYDAQFVLLGSAAEGDHDGKSMEHAFWYFENMNRGRAVAYIGFVPELAQKIYAASDIYLVPSLYEPCGLSQLVALKYGAIPVARETGGLADTVEDSFHGTGNGFTFRDYNAGALRYAIERALWGYMNREGWDILTKRAMNGDFSWDAGPVHEYIALFKRLMG
jgi:starch synthase